MRRLGGFLIISMYLLLALFGCSKADTNQAQNQPAAAPQTAAQAQETQQPAAQQTAAQAQPPEAAPARAAGTKAAAPRPASQPAAPPASAQTAVTPAGGSTEVKPVVPAAGATKQVSEATPVPVTTPTPPPPPPPPPPPIVIASGTRLEVRLIDPISAADNKTGDTFRATLDQDLEVGGTVVAPRGSMVKGKLVEVKQSGRVEGLAAMSITLTGIELGKSSYPIQTNTLAFEAEKSTKGDAAKIGIGAGIGAVIGAIAGGGKGAAIGAAVGGGAGTATVLVTKGKDVKFGAEERFSFILRSNLEIKR
jgi:hypothetical protein